MTPLSLYSARLSTFTIGREFPRSRDIVTAREIRVVVWEWFSDNGVGWHESRFWPLQGAFAGYSMLKILRTVEGTSVIFVLSGRIEAEHLAELRALVDAEAHAVALDLKEVTLVDRDTVRFLAGCEANGVELRTCPGYVRQWIETENRR